MYIHNTTLNFKLLSVKTCQIYNILEKFTYSSGLHPTYIPMATDYNL